MSTIHVGLPDASHDVTIERGVLRRLGEIVAGVAPGGRALLAVDTRIAATHGETALASLRDAGYETAVVTLTAEEGHKTLATVTGLYDAMLAAGLDRGSPVVALGGGVVGDTAGFAAATFMRGVPLVQTPTTLLAMVDASIGGKTGVNVTLPGGGLGKNLVGVFRQPGAVVSDPDVLRTLEARDFRCGLAECVKHAVIADAALLELMETRAEAILALDADTLVTLIERCARIKVEIVEADERETGRRALLNLGHTFAHAIEAQRGDVRHGEAVSIGLAAAMRCAVRTGRLDEGDAERVTRRLEGFGLPVRLPGPASTPALLDAMRYDKKTRAGRLRLVLPAGLGAAEVADDVPPDVVREAWAAVGAGA